MATVCALLGPGASEAAVTAQERPVDEVVDGEDSIAPALARALATRVEWLWILPDASIPAPSWLACVVAALSRTRGLAAPAALCGVVRDDLGALATPTRYRRAPTEAAMAAAAQGLLPVWAASGPVLVRRAAAAAARGPRSRLGWSGATLEWSARLVGAGAGYLAPEAESQLNGAPARPGPATVAAVVAGASVTGFDRIRAAGDLLAR